MTLTCPESLRRARAVARVLLLPAALALVMCGCSNNTNRGVSGYVGVGTGVTLTTPGSVTLLVAGAATPVYAYVTNDVNNDGVQWQITPANVGTFSNNNLQFNYTSPGPCANATPAPGCVVGAQSVTITAISIANPANYASVTLIIYGYPTANVTPLFPAFENVAYAASLSLSGGVEPYTWNLLSSTTTPQAPPVPAGSIAGVPPGMVLNGSTGTVTTVSGTPTATGTYVFTVQVVDSYTPARSITATYTLIVKPALACLLQGQYSLYFTGFRGGGSASHIASVSIDQNSGVVTGEQDYKDGHRVTPHETLTTGGLCANHSTNTGTLTLVAPSGALQYEFAATLPDANGNINSARLQLIGSGNDTGSGAMIRQTTTSFTAGTSLPANNYAFGLLGVANQEPYTVHYGSAGRFTTDAAGNLSLGQIDSNSTTAPLDNATLTGAMSAPDANGRGTLALTSGSQSSSLVYYIVNASKMFLMDIGPTVGTPRQSGFLTTQTGDATATTFDNNAFSSPSIMSLWGAEGSAEPIAVAELGRLYNANGAAATFGNAELDISSQSIAISPATFTNQPYAVSSSGRGTMSLTNSASPQRNFVFYLDGVSDGYLIEQGSTTGNAGLLEAQYTPAPQADGSIQYPNTLSTFFAGGTQFPMAAGPVILMPLVSLSEGTLSSTYTTGVFAVNPADGRGFGTMTDAGVGEAGAAMYMVSPDKVDVLRFAYRSIDASLEWFGDL